MIQQEIYADGDLRNHRQLTEDQDKTPKECAGCLLLRSSGNCNQLTWGQPSNWKGAPADRPRRIHRLRVPRFRLHHGLYRSRLC